MNVKSFITGNDYQEFKQTMLDSFITKPLDIKSTDADGIALEVRASQIAIEKLVKAFKNFELKAKPEIQIEKPYR